MIDIEILRFYNNVKDPLWPNIRNYCEYQQLPTHIKHECDVLHNFQSHKDNLCNSDYWISQTLDVCVYKNLAYVPVPKCALSYHTTLFTNLNWKKIKLCDVDIENTKFFGLIMHPLERRLKGITQWLTESYYENDIRKSESNIWLNEENKTDWAQLQSDMSTKYFKNLLSTVGFGDWHSFPYSVMFGSLLDKVNWIPMDTLTKTEIPLSLMSFFNLHGYDIQLPLDSQPIHVSSKNQMQVYHIVKEIFNNNHQYIYQFYKIYGNDLKFYYNLVDKFTPDWQHI
jgi:hypothetical protein